MAGQPELSSMLEESIWDCSPRTLSSLCEQAGLQEDSTLENLADMRQRLVLISRLQRGAHLQWENMFSSLKSDNEAKVAALHPILEQMKTILKDVPMEPLSDILHEEKHLKEDNLLEELIHRQHSLSENAEVIVLGETNGGKTSLLNLILGQDILPTSFTSCTMIICKIQYAESYCVKVTRQNGQCTEYRPDSLEKAKEILRHKVAERDPRARERDSGITQVTVQMPAHILECGVTLVDTPGIGETDELDDMVLNYLRGTYTSAFIYVIKTDTGGGLQRDRLMPFLQAIREQYSNRGGSIPRAVFICHRWDNVGQQSRERIKANAFSKLESVWPEFKPSQTFFFSTTDTQKHLSVDERYVPDSFYQLMKGFRDLFKWATNNGVILHQYNWMKTILSPSRDHLRAMITHCIGTTEDLENDFRQVALKQERLLTDSETQVTLLNREVREVMQKVTDIISDIFNLDRGDVQGFPEYDELLKEFSNDSGRLSKEKRVKMDERLVECILHYADTKIEETQLIENLEKTILQKIQDHLGLFRTQVLQIKQDLMAGSQSSRQSNTSLTALDTSRSSFMSSLRSDEVDSEFVSFTADPVQLATMVTILLKELQVMKRHSQKRQSRFEMGQNVFGKMRDLLKYKEVDPALYIEDRCLKISDHIRHGEGIIQEIVAAYTDWIEDCVERASASIPQFTAVNERLMSKIRQHRNVLIENKETLKKAMQVLEKSRSQMRGFGSLYMKDIDPDSLNLDVPISLPADLAVSVRSDSGFADSGSDKKKIRSIWARLQTATVEVGGHPQMVMIKSYLCHLEEDRLLTEIAELRCLQHPKLAHFFGMTRLRVGNDTSEGASTIPETINSFIFLGDLISAKMFAQGRLVNLREWVPKMILSLLGGLNFIHRERLVHMELNTDTITIDKESGDVKLCHFGLPHTAILPSRATFPTKSCVCLSPSVLRGAEYQAEDDVYAFALVLWEMLYPRVEPLFAEQRQWPLNEFIVPVAMLKARIETLDEEDPVRQVLEAALFPEQSNTTRLSVMAIQRMLGDLQNNPAVQALRSRKISHQLRRHSKGLNTSQEHIVHPVPPPRTRRPPLISSTNQADGSEDGRQKTRASCPNLSATLTEDDTKRLAMIASTSGKKKKQFRIPKAFKKKASQRSKTDSDEEAKDTDKPSSRRRFSLTNLFKTKKSDLVSSRSQARHHSEVAPPPQHNTVPGRSKRRSGLSSVLSGPPENFMNRKVSPAESTSSLSIQRHYDGTLQHDHGNDKIAQQAQVVLENDLSASQRSSPFTSSQNLGAEGSPHNASRVHFLDAPFHSKEITRSGSLTDIPRKRSPKRYRAPTIPPLLSELGSSTRSHESVQSLPPIFQRHSFTIDSEYFDRKILMLEYPLQDHTSNASLEQYWNVIKINLSNSSTPIPTTDDTSESETNTLGSASALVEEFQYFDRNMLMLEYPRPDHTSNTSLEQYRNVTKINLSNSSTPTPDDTSESETNKLGSASSLVEESDGSASVLVEDFQHNEIYGASPWELTQSTASCQSLPTSDLSETKNHFSKSQSSLEASTKEYSSNLSMGPVSKDGDRQEDTSPGDTESDQTDQSASDEEQKRPHGRIGSSSTS